MVWLVDIVFLLMELQPPSAPPVFLYLLYWRPVISQMDGCKHLPVYLSGSDRDSWEKAISGSCQLHSLASAIVSAFDDCIWDGSPGGAVSG